MPIIMSEGTSNELTNLLIINTYAVTLHNGKLVQNDATGALRAAGYVVVHIDDLPADDVAPTSSEERS